MTAYTSREEATERPSSSRANPANESGVLEDAQSLWHELRELTHDRFLLAALETQRAGHSLVMMIISGVMVALLLTSAWLGIMVVAVLELIEKDVTASSAILLAVVANLLIALILCSVIRLKAYYLKFPATLRSLQSMPKERRKSVKS